MYNVRAVAQHARSAHVVTGRGTHLLQAFRNAYIQAGQCDTPKLAESSPPVAY